MKQEGDAPVDVRVHRLQEDRTLLTVREQLDLHTAPCLGDVLEPLAAAAMNQRLPHHQGHGRPSGTDRPPGPRCKRRCVSPASIGWSNASTRRCPASQRSFAFTLLGLSVPLGTFAAQGAWADGLALAALLVLVARPLAMAVLLWPLRLRGGERVFLAFAGLKGAVPILLGSFVVSARLPHSQQIYDVVFVVVAFSVIVQGALVPTVARTCRIPMRAQELEPWALGVRLRDRPEGARRVVVERGSPADGCAVGDLDLGEHAWVSLVIREGRLLPASGTTRLEAGDEVLLLTDPEQVRDPTGPFRQ